MAKRKKRRSHTTKRSKARARRRRFNHQVNRSVAKNRRTAHYAWKGFKRQCYTLFNKGYITTGNALAEAHYKRARRKMHHTHVRSHTHISRKSRAKRRTRTKRRIRTPYRRNLHKSLAFSRGIHKAEKHYTEHRRNRAECRTRRIRSPYRTNLRKSLHYDHGSKKSKHKYSKHRAKYTTKRYTKYGRSEAAHKTRKKTHSRRLRKARGIRHSARQKSVGRRRGRMEVMTGGTGRELGAKDTGKGFRGATAPEVSTASHNSKAETVKKHKTSKKRKTVKKRRAKKTTKRRTTKKRRITKKRSRVKKRAPKKNTLEEKEISELRDQLAELKEQNNNMQKIIEQMKQTVLTMQDYRNFNTSLNQQATQQLNAQNNLPYDGMRQQMTTTSPSFNNMTHTINANLTNRNNQLEANDMNDPALNNTNYSQALSGNPIPGDTSHGRFYAQPAVPSPNSDPNQYYFDNFEDAYKEAHLNDNNTYENGTSYAQNGRNGIIMDLDPVQQAKAIELYQQKQMPQITTQAQPAPSINLQTTAPSVAYTAPTQSYNQQATVAAQTAAQNEQANRDKAAIQAEANSQKIDTIKNTIKPQTDQNIKSEAKKANAPKKPTDAKQASSLKKPKQPTTYSSIDVNSVDLALAYNNEAKTQSYGLSQ